jgi:hypothetical protein
VRSGVVLKFLHVLFVGVVVAAVLFLGWIVYTGLARDGKHGVSSVVTLRPGEKLVNATWRDANLWLLTRGAKAGEAPEEHVFREVSRMGWFEESVVIQEK